MRRRYALGLVLAINIIAGCATNTPAKGQFDPNNQVPGTFWSGRLALKIASEPPQSFFASFELQGRAASGSLSLFSPVSTVAVMNWTPGEATLKSSGAADAVPQRFASVEDMLNAVSGAPIPVPALFDWLAGRSAAAPGWTVDLSQQPEGRIVASRTAPQPALELRVVLDK
jgi:outer membrane lipoprotein LolB